MIALCSFAKRIAIPLAVAFLLVFLGRFWDMPWLSTQMALVGFLVFLAIYILASFWEKRLTVNERHMLFPQFHEIDIESLKSHLFPWVTADAHKDLLKKVVLYRVSAGSSVPVGVKYILFFDVVYNRKTEMGKNIHRTGLKEQIPIQGNDFRRVYKGDAPSNFHDEWLLTDEKPSDLFSKNAVVLFSKNFISRFFHMPVASHPAL